MTNSAAPPGPLTMTFDSELIEDFMHTEDILADTSSAAPLAVFLSNEGKSEALVISKSGGGDELYHVCREPLSDSGWNVYGVGAYAAAVAAVDSGALWAVGTDNRLWQNRNGRWSAQVPQLPSGATPPPPNPSSAYVPVSVGTDGTVWAVDSQGTLYQHAAGANGGQWELFAGLSQLSQAPAGSAEMLLAISNNEITLYDAESKSTAATPLPGGATPRQVSVGAGESAWAIDQSGNLYRYNSPDPSGGWQRSAGAPPLYMIAAVAADNVWGITYDGSSYVLEHFDGAAWQPAAGAPPLGAPPPAAEYMQKIYAHLSAAPDGTVWCVDTNGVAWKCAPGRAWQRQMMPTGMSGGLGLGNVTQVVAGKDGNGWQAFYTTSGGFLIWMSLTAAGTWRPIQLKVIRCNSLGAVNQLTDKALIVYGADDDGDMVVLSSSSSYGVETFAAHGMLKGASIYLNAISPDAWFTAAVCGDALYVQLGNAQNPLNYGNVGYMYPVTNSPVKLERMVNLPWVETPIGFYCAVLGTDGNIYTAVNLQPYVNSINQPVNQFQGNFVPLTGRNAATPAPLSAVTSTGALIDGSGYARIYATDSNQKLWVIRQTGYSGNENSPWAWTAWHPLGDHCRYLADGPGTHATHELFTLDESNFLNRLWQDPLTSNWNDAVIRRPTGTADAPYYVTQYETEITVLDANGNPKPNVEVSVTASESVAVWVSGVQHDLDPTHAATLVTNMMGKASVSTLALGLHTAQLTFAADGFAVPYEVYPPQKIQDRLKDVDGATLKGAQARTQSVPVERGESLVAQSKQGTCDPAAEVIRDVFQIKLLMNLIPAKPTGAAPGGAAPTYDDLRAAWAAKVVSVRPAAATAAGAGAALDAGWSFDDFWNDLARFGEDIWHAVKKGILVVAGVAVDAAKGAIDVTLAFGELGSYVVSLVVKTIDDVAHAVVAAFRWLGAEVVRVIDWLKSFFSWGDIINTKNVIEHYINQVLTNVAADCEPGAANNFQQLVAAQFQSLKNRIAGGGGQPSAFDGAQTTFGANSFNGSVGGVKVDPRVGSNALQPDGVKGTYHAHQVKCNYTHRKTETYVRQGGTVIPPGGGASALRAPGGGDDSFGDFLGRAQSTLAASPSYQTAQANYNARLQKLQSTKGFFDTAVTDFLDLVKDIVLALIDLVEEIVRGLLDLVSEAARSFQGVLNYELDIPVLSWLYKELTGHALTLLDLLCLIMAIPATLIYKLIWGGSSASPPFSAQDAERIAAGPIPWPQIQGSGFGVSPMPLLPAAPGAERDPAALPLGVLALVNSILYAFVDLGTDIDAMAPGEQDWSKFWSWTALFLTLGNLGFTVPYGVLEKGKDERTVADDLAVAVWAAGGLSLALNVGSVASLKVKKLAKYVSPVTVMVFGLLQLGVGIAAAVEFGKSGGAYNAAYSAGAIVTPIPSVFKPLLLTKNEEWMLVLGPIDLLCDVGGGGCSLIEAVT